MSKALKLSILLLLLVATSASQVMAIPSLQLWIDGATFDAATETWVTTSTDFDLYVIGLAGASDVKVSMAMGPTDTPAGASVSVNGTSFSSWTYGFAPLANDPAIWNGGNDDLPKHSIFPSWFTEFDALSYGNIGGIGNVNADSAAANSEPFWFPTSGYITGGNHRGQFRKFTIETTGILSLHFDAYTQNQDGTIDKFAPFSHDAGMAVPEPATLVLFGLGLAGAGIVRQRRRKT